MLLSSIVHAVILPATPLLVPGTVPGLRTDPLADVRQAVSAALARLTAGDRVPLVLAHGPALRHGRLRPSLVGSGIGDRWLPDDARRLWAPGLPVAGTGASVALLALADVLGARAADVEVLEVPPAWTGSDGAGPDGAGADPVRDALRAAAGLVVAGGGAPGGLETAPEALTAGVRAALRAVGFDAWTPQVFAQSHDHLPPSYQVTTLT
ncbi:hypothetical protein [Promicromonospora sp. NPDC057488]|uniref:hypothetical protein n=1 Tax=Promicromonospora sp. NPDC057488 TaxID=3346147 RepID=UPI00366AAF44